MASCSYNCEIDPGRIEPYGDISGIGVFVSFVATAYIAVFIMIGHYLFAFQPNLDQSGQAEQTTTVSRSTRSNPVDIWFLSFLRLSSVGDSQWQGTQNLQISRLKEACNKCVISISNLQIMTGIPLLISGFASLRCGLSAYHWQVLMYLARFSAITQLSALVFLRSHLYGHPRERFWRLFSMFVFMCMFSVATIPTAGFGWLFENDSRVSNSPSEYAVCYFGRTPKTGNLAFKSMASTTALLMFNFCTCVVKLHRSLSTIMRGVRSNLSLRYQNQLQKLRAWSENNSSGKYWKTAIIYRPALGIFLVLRVMTDTYSSMLMEAYGLILSTAWATMHLIKIRNLFDDGDNDWKFGQILTVVLLASPLIAVVEHLYPKRKETNGMTTEGSIADSHLADVELSLTSGDTSLPERLVFLNDTERDYYKDVAWFRALLVFLLILVIFVSATLLVYAGLGLRVRW